MLYSEMDAAHEFHLKLSEYFALPREERITMNAFLFAKRALHAMSDFDNHEQAKKKGNK